MTECSFCSELFQLFKWNNLISDAMNKHLTNGNSRGSGVNGGMTTSQFSSGKHVGMRNECMHERSIWCEAVMPRALRYIG